MFDSDTQLIVSIFRRVFQLVSSEERVSGEIRQDLQIGY